MGTRPVSDIDINPFSIDPSGEWSDRKADKVLDVIQPEAEIMGLRFIKLDLSTNDRPNRVLLVPRRLSALDLDTE